MVNIESHPVVSLAIELQLIGLQPGESPPQDRICPDPELLISELLISELLAPELLTPELPVPEALTPCR